MRERETEKETERWRETERQRNRERERKGENKRTCTWANTCYGRKAQVKVRELYSNSVLTFYQVNSRDQADWQAYGRCSCH